MEIFKKGFDDPFDEVLSNAINDSMKRFEFYKRFLGLDLTVLGSVSTDDEGDDSPTLHLKYIEVENELVLPVYSSFEKFHSIFQSNYTYVKINTQELLQLVEPNTAWVLNPGFNLSKKIIPEEIKTMRDGSILKKLFEQLSPEKKTLLLEKQVTELSSTTLEQISSCFRTISAIKKAYLTSVFDPLTWKRAVPLVGIELDIQDKEKSYELLIIVSKAVNQITTDLPKIELVVLDPTHPFSDLIVGNIEPIYAKNTIDDLESFFL